MSQKPVLNVAFPVVDDAGLMTEPFRKYMATLGYALPIVGAGTPEAAVEANQFSIYINSTGTTGTLMYVKKLTDIGNDKTKGWVAV